jgi:FkbM family methyltransferase
MSLSRRVGRLGNFGRSFPAVGSWEESHQLKSAFKHAVRNLIVTVSRAVPQSLRSGLASSSYSYLVRRVLNWSSEEGNPVVRIGRPLGGQSMRVNWALHKTYVFGTHEPGVVSGLEELVQPGWTAIDVGANIGYFTLLLANRVGPLGKVIAFEPLAENFNILQENIKLNSHRNVVAENLALMSRTERIELRSATPGAITWVASVRVDQNSAVESQSVEATSLDEYVHKNGIAKIDFLKIDVEGAEASVLAGARSVLDRDKPILLIELHELDRFKDKHPAILKLRDHNYQIRSLGMREWQEHVIAEPLGKLQMQPK